MRAGKFPKTVQFLPFIIVSLSLVLAACGSAGTTTRSTATAEASAVPPPAATTESFTPEPTLAETSPSPVENTAPALASPVAPGTGETAVVQVQPTSAPTALPTSSDVQSFPDPNAYQWQPYAAGLAYPIGMAVPGDGSGRIFVVEKAGLIVIVKDGQVAQQPFLDIHERVGSSGSEQGLLGLAFDPKYAQNGRFYVNYTDVNGNTVISRFNVSSGDPNIADPGSEFPLISQDQPYPNHNGGETVFGPDGYLYLGLGDGGSAGDPNGNGQSVVTLLGKIMRIDVSQGQPYSIPADNPFKSGGRPEIWAYGLRNPWRFSFDMKTGDLYIADVGQNKWEEIDYVPAGTPGGLNFGWNYKEGTHAFQGQPPSNLRLTDPVFEYGHDQGCSVTGGYVYRGPSLPAWQGIYLFGDYCSGRVWGLLRVNGQWQSQQLFDTSFAISSFGQDETGEVYLVDVNGNLFKLAKK